jgi:hypothetical protein
MWTYQLRIDRDQQHRGDILPSARSAQPQDDLRGGVGAIAALGLVFAATRAENAKVIYFFSIILRVQRTTTLSLS